MPPRRTTLYPLLAAALVAASAASHYLAPSASPRVEQAAAADVPAPATEPSAGAAIESPTSLAVPAEHAGLFVNEMALSH